MTETLTHIASRQINGNTSAFLPLPEVRLTTDQRGCLAIQVPYLFDEKIITNDVVELNQDHTFELKGRIDNVINTGGVKIIPEEIESRLSKYIHHPFFVTGIQDNVLGQRVVLVVEGEESPNAFDESVKKGGLSKYEQPKEIYTLAAFSRTPNGKIQRAETLAQLDL